MSTLIIGEAMNCRESPIIIKKFRFKFQAYLYKEFYYFLFANAYRKDVVYGNLYSRIL